MPPAARTRANTVARRRLAAAIVVAALVASCAPKAVRVGAPAAPRYPAFVYPVVPAGVGDAALADRLEQGWFRLQADDVRGAERELTAVLTRAPRFYPATAASAYLEIARKRPREALALADRALGAAPAYAPALAARGEALLALHREDEALRAFEAALAADGSLADIGRRVEVLRFRDVQQAIAAARTAAAANRLAEARAAYERAIAATPESGFLYRELAALERKSGDREAALQHLRKALALDPADARAQAELGDVLAESEQFDAAVAAYRASLAIEANDAVQVRLEQAEARARLARLPADYRAIPDAPEITRADLAALVGVRLEPLVRAAARRQATVMTDVRGHWAAPWIATTVRAGVLDAFPNHTFQPRSRVRRGELAAALSRVLQLVAANRPDVAAAWTRPDRRIADVSPGHLMYPAISRVVAAGVLPLLPGGTFQVSRPVSGAEAIAALDRIAALQGGPGARH